MERVFRSVLEALDRVVDAVGGWGRGGAAAIDPFQPGTWPAGFWALVGALAVLLVLALYRGRNRRPSGNRAPELLVTRGEVVPDPGARRGGAGTLTATVSNMSRFPVQVIEVAVRTGGGRRFGVAEVGALVPAMGDVEIEARLPVGRLEDGVLDVYAYAAATRVKTFRHRAELIWEPWAKRFKVAPLEQRIVPTRSLASARADVVRLEEEDDAVTGAWATAPAAAASGRRSGSRHGVGGADRVGEAAPRGASGREGWEPRAAHRPDARGRREAPPAAVEVPTLPPPPAATQERAPGSGPADLFAMLDERPPLSRRATPAQVLALNDVLVTDVDGPAADDDDAAAPIAPAGRAVPVAGRGAVDDAAAVRARGRDAATDRPGFEPHRVTEPDPADRPAAEPSPARTVRTARTEPTQGASRASGAPVPRPPRSGAEARATRTAWGQRTAEEPPADPAKDRADRVAAARERLLERRRRRAEEEAAEAAPDDGGRPRRRPDDGPLEFPDEF